VTCPILSSIAMMELADYYVAGTVQPGRSVGLLRRVLGAVTGQAGPVSERQVLNQPRRTGSGCFPSRVSTKVLAHLQRSSDTLRRGNRRGCRST